MSKSEIRFRVKNAAATQGWLSGGSPYRVTHAPRPFGRTHWIVKSNGHAVMFLQDQSNGLNGKVTDSTPEQRQIVKWLQGRGVIADVQEPGQSCCDYCHGSATEETSLMSGEPVRLCGAQACQEKYKRALGDELREMKRVGLIPTL